MHGRQARANFVLRPGGHWHKGERHQGHTAKQQELQAGKRQATKPSNEAKRKAKSHVTNTKDFEPAATANPKINQNLKRTRARQREGREGDRGWGQGAEGRIAIVSVILNWNLIQHVSIYLSYVPLMPIRIQLAIIQYASTSYQLKINFVATRHILLKSTPKSPHL